MRWVKILTSFQMNYLGTWSPNPGDPGQVLQTLSGSVSSFLKDAYLLLGGEPHFRSCTLQIVCSSAAREIFLNCKSDFVSSKGFLTHSELKKKKVYGPGVSNLLASPRHTEKRGVLGHTWNTLWHIITKKSHNVLSKFMILCWAAFTATLACMWPRGRRLDTPGWLRRPQWLSLTLPCPPSSSAAHSLLHPPFLLTLEFSEPTPSVGLCTGWSFSLEHSSPALCMDENLPPLSLLKCHLLGETCPGYPV